jgi:hypothetical protein
VGNLLARSIVFCGRSMVVACDGRCDRAWGVQERPRTALSPGDPDDFVWLGDEHEDARTTPGREHLVSEGGDLRPSDVALSPGDSVLMNRWCARACERSVLVEVVLPDMVNPRPNKKSR